MRKDVLQATRMAKKEILEVLNGKPSGVLCVLCGLSNAGQQRPSGVFALKPCY